jgi:hypothetical protein
MVGLNASVFRRFTDSGVSLRVPSKGKRSTRARAVSRRLEAWWFPVAIKLATLVVLAVFGKGGKTLQPTVAPHVHDYHGRTEQAGRPDSHSDAGDSERKGLGEMLGGRSVKCHRDVHAVAYSISDKARIDSDNRNLT